MARVTARVERRQSYCPRCETTRGIPFQVDAGPCLVVIAYHCESCGQEWIVPGAPRDVHLQLTRNDSTT
jgi:hypothetical protein